MTGFSGVLLARQTGSQYAFSTADASGNAFDGAKNYEFSIPANVPAADFWS